VEPDGTVGSFQLFDKANPSVLLAPGSSAGTSWVVTPVAPLPVVANPVLQSPAALQANLAVVQQNLLVSGAQVRSTQASLSKQRTELATSKELGGIIFDLTKEKALSETDSIRARSEIERAHADLARAEADLESAKQKLGPEGDANPQLQQARAALAQAQLDFTNTTVRAPADGLTIGIGHLGTNVFNGALYNLQYDLVKDLEPIALLPSNTSVIVTRPDVPARNLKELVAWLKANPDQASAATAGIGGVTMSLYDSSGVLVRGVNTALDGNYSLTGIPGGANYKLVPSKTGLVFTPAYRSYTNLPADQTLQNFTGK
jgi:hypothetical protein